MSTILLGCIADDFTGATDLANNLVRAGMRTLQTIGTPKTKINMPTDAVVIALKSRTIPVDEAVEQSLNALQWLRSCGAQQIYFKYCSTFDSTAKGNIGPVAEALMSALATDFTIATPAFPENKRFVFQGHLFLGNQLLNESGMQNHPLTPMNDSNLVRVLQSQCISSVGLIDYECVTKGSNSIEAKIQELRSNSVSMAIVDAISNHDLLEIGRAIRSLPLVTGGSGIAIGLPQNFSLPAANMAQVLPPVQGFQAIISGSCSQATNLQVATFIAAGLPAHQLDPFVLAKDPGTIQQLIDWATSHLHQGPVLIYSTTLPETVKMIQLGLGISQAGNLIESALATIASGLVAAGVQQLIIAGGEVSGACVQALGIEQLQIGPQIDPGVPWCYANPDSSEKEGFHIALKSGNFGSPDFFLKSFGILQ
ncbi:Four-carbon acid sugar kinase, N-terminal domain containing protein [Burkholderiaceae bacterium]|jgi:uncharacterized protein YgbK (DUF1537 family)